MVRGGTSAFQAVLERDAGAYDCYENAEPDAGDELPPRLSARGHAAIRTPCSRSILRFRRQSLSFAFGPYRMPLRLIIIVVVRVQCLLLPFDGLRLFVQWRLEEGAYGVAQTPAAGILLVACVFAVAGWQLAPWLARLILGQRDADVTLAGICLEDLYRFAFVFLGLYLALNSVAPTLTWAHYTFSVAATSVGRTAEQGRALYGLLHPAISVALGLVCVFKGPGWATTLAAKDKRTEPGAPPNSRPPSPLPTSPEIQPSDSLRTPSSGGCG